MPDSEPETRPRSRRRETEPEEALPLERVVSALDGMSVGELRQIANAAEAKIREKAEGEKRALREEVERRAADLGITIRDLFGEPVQPARRGRGRAARKGEGEGPPPKYKGPHGELWSGRGRMPKWLQDAQARAVFLALIVEHELPVRVAPADDPGVAARALVAVAHVVDHDGVRSAGLDQQPVEGAEQLGGVAVLVQAERVDDWA